jgi:hypothetical protein
MAWEASVSRAGRKPTDDLEFLYRLVRSLALPAGNLFQKSV